MTISEKLRQQVIVEADYRCEHCKTSSRLTGTPPVMEHILPRSLVDLTEDTIAQVRRAFRSRQTTTRCLKQLDSSERVFYGYYRTAEDAVTVANAEADIEYRILPWSV